MKKKLISTLLSLAMVAATLPMTMLTASASVDDVVVSRGKKVVVVGDTRSEERGPIIVDGLRTKGGAVNVSQNSDIFYGIQFQKDTVYGYIDLGKTYTITKILTSRRGPGNSECGNLSYYASNTILNEQPTQATEGVTYIGTLGSAYYPSYSSNKITNEADVTVTAQETVTGRYIYFDSDYAEGLKEIEVYSVPDTEPQDLLYGKTGTKNDDTQVTVYTDHATAGVGTNVGKGNWVRYDLGFEANLKYFYCYFNGWVYHRPGLGVKAGNTTDFDAATVLIKPSPSNDEEFVCGSRVEISGRYRYIWLYSDKDNCYLDDVRIYGVDDRQYVLGDWSFTEANGEYKAEINVEYINATSQEFNVWMINYDEEGNMVGNPTVNSLVRTENASSDIMSGTIPSGITVDHTQVVLVDENMRLVSMHNENHGGTWAGFNANKGTDASFQNSVSMATSAEYPFDDVSITVSGKAVEADDLIMITATVDTGVSTFASEPVDGYYYMAYANANNGYEFNIPLNIAGDYEINVTRIPADSDAEMETVDLSYTLIEPEDIKAAINAFFPEDGEEADYGTAIDNAIDTVGIIGAVDIIDRDIIYNTDFAEVANPIGELFKEVDAEGNVALNTDELIDAVNTMIVVYKLRDGDASVMEEYGDYITENDEVQAWVDANLPYSLTASVTCQDDMVGLTNIGESGAVKFELTDDMNPDSLTENNIVLKKGEDVVPYDIAKATKDEFYIDLGSLDANSEYIVTFTSEIETLAGKKMLEEVTYEFTTGQIIKTPYKEGTVIKNVLLNKPVANTPAMKALGAGVQSTDPSSLNDGSSGSSVGLLPGNIVAFDLGAYYDLCAVRYNHYIMGDGSTNLHHINDVTFLGMSYPELGEDGKPTAESISSEVNPKLFYTEGAGGSAQAKHHGNVYHTFSDSVKTNLENYGPIRYFLISAGDDSTYVTEVEAYAYVDVEIGDITVNNSTVASGSNHTFSVDITENATTGNTWYIIINAYDANGHTTAKTIRQLTAMAKSAQITATADTVGITAMMVDDLATMNQVTAPLTIGTPMQSQATLGAGVQIKGSTSEIQMSAKEGGDVAKISNASMLVIKESATSGGSAADVFASLTQTQLENGLVFANANTVRDGLAYAISDLDTGKYYIQVVASNNDGTKRAVAQYKQAIVDDTTKDAIIADIMSAEGDELADALVAAIYTDEIISVDAMDDGANLRAKLESENMDAELGYTRFVELLGYTKDMLYPEGADNATTQDVIDLVNAAQTVYALDNEDAEKAAELLGSYGTQLGESYIPAADKTKLANIFANVNENIDDSASLEDAIKWSGLLSFMVDATDGEVAEAMEDYADMYGIDLSYASDRKVSLSRVANFLGRSDVMDLYGEEAFGEAYENAVKKAKASQSQVSGTGSTNNMSGGAGFAATDRGGNSSENKPTPTPTPTAKPAASGFGDMQGYMWADEAVAALVEAGVIDGNEKGEFEPARSVTRAEFVKMLVVASKIKVDEAEGMHFIDVPNNSWQYPYVKIAFSRKICKGTDDYHFNPNGTITRQDMAVMLSNMLTYLGVDAKGSEKTFTDSQNVADYATSAVTTASKAGLINGFDDGSFRPHDNTRRVDAAMVVGKLLNVIE